MSAKFLCTGGPLVWKETVGGTVRFVVRFVVRFDDHPGMWMFHCHILDHEDQGMMMPIEFIPPYQVPKPAATAQAAATPQRCSTPRLLSASTACRLRRTPMLGEWKSGFTA